MSRGTFNYSQSPDTYDHGRAEFYRQQDEARRLQELVARATHWFGLRLVGKEFTTLDALRAACVEIAAERYGQVDDETAGVIGKAVTNLWLGRVKWALFWEPAVRATVTEEPRTVTFATAA